MAIDTKLIQQLRQLTGAGISDCKKALEDTNGDVDEAVQLLRKKGLAKASTRAVGSQGTVALAVEGDKAALAEVKSETDFVAASPEFKVFVEDIAQLVLHKGEGALSERDKELEDLKIKLKEGIAFGAVARIEAGAGNHLGTYLHEQGGRGVNGVIVEVSGADADKARELALHISFAKPRYIRRDEVPADVVERERALLEEQTRNEGKPEAALPKIVEGKLNGFFKEICLLEQAYVRDEKQSVKQFLAGGDVERFAQAYIG